MIAAEVAPCDQMPQVSLMEHKRQKFDFNRPLIVVVWAGIEVITKSHEKSHDEMNLVDEPFLFSPFLYQAIEMLIWFSRRLQNTKNTAEVTRTRIQFKDNHIEIVTQCRCEGNAAKRQQTLAARF